MDAVMPRADNYFEKWLEDKFENVEAKIDANTSATEEIGKRLSALEHTVNGTPTKSELPPFYRDPKVVQTILYLSITVLLIVAAVVKVDVSKLL